MSRFLCCIRPSAAHEATSLQASAKDGSQDTPCPGEGRQATSQQPAAATAKSSQQPLVPVEPSMLAQRTTDTLAKSMAGDLAKRIADLPVVLLSSSDAEEARLLAVAENGDSGAFVVLSGASRARAGSAVNKSPWPIGSVFSLHTNASDGAVYPGSSSLQKLYTAKVPVVAVMGSDYGEAPLPKQLEAGHPADLLELHIEYGFTHLAVVPLTQGQHVVGAVALFGQHKQTVPKGISAKLLSTASTYHANEVRCSSSEVDVVFGQPEKAGRVRKASVLGPLPPSPAALAGANQAPLAAPPGFPVVPLLPDAVSIEQLTKNPTDLKMLGSCLSLACISLDPIVLGQLASAMQSVAQAPSLPQLAVNLAASLELFCTRRLHTMLNCHVALIPGGKAQVGMFMGLQADAPNNDGTPTAGGKQSCTTTSGRRVSLGRRTTMQSSSRIHMSGVGSLRAAPDGATSTAGGPVSKSVVQQLVELRPQKSEQLHKMQPYMRSHSSFNVPGGHSTPHLNATSLLRGGGGAAGGLASELAGVGGGPDSYQSLSMTMALMVPEPQLPWRAVGFKAARSLMNMVLREEQAMDGELFPGSCVKAKTVPSCRAFIQETQGGCTDLNVLARHSETAPSTDLPGSLLLVCLTINPDAGSGADGNAGYAGPGADGNIGSAGSGAKQQQQVLRAALSATTSSITLGLYLTSDEVLPEMLLERAREKCWSLLSRVLLPVLRHRLLGDLAGDVSVLREAASKPVDGERGAVQSINLSCNPEAMMLPASSHNSFSTTPRHNGGFSSTGTATTVPNFPSQPREPGAALSLGSRDISPSHSTKLSALAIRALGKQHESSNAAAASGGVGSPYHTHAGLAGGKPPPGLTYAAGHGGPDRVSSPMMVMERISHVELGQQQQPTGNNGTSTGAAGTATTAGNEFHMLSMLSSAHGGGSNDVHAGGRLMASSSPSINTVQLDLVLEPADISMQAQVDALRKAVHGALSGLLVDDSRESGPGRYQPQDLQHLVLGEVLGRGGNGVVLRGSLYGMEVAVKVFDFPEDIDVDALDAPEEPQTSSAREQRQRKEDSVAAHHRRALARLATELAVCSSISHPSIVQVYAHFTGVSLVKDTNNADVFTLQPAAPADEWDTTYIANHSAPCVAVVMDMCDLGGLDAAIEQKRFMQRGTTLPNMSAILRTLLEVAMALRHLHSLNLVHCDLKPGNVLLKSSSSDSRGFTGKLSDFGYTTLMRERDSNGRPCLIMEEAAGTLPYMAPEIFIKGMTTNEKIDIYALGIMAWQLFTGQKLYPGVKPNELGYLVVQKELRPQFPPTTPHGYRALAEACWHKDARRRPSAASVIRALSLLLSQYRSRATAASARQQLPPPQQPQLPVAAAAAAPAVPLPATLPPLAPQLLQPLQPPQAALPKQSPLATVPVAAAAAAPL